MIILATVLIIICVAIALVFSYLDIRERSIMKKSNHTQTICGCCGGPDCIVGCDNPPSEFDRIVTVDEIRYTAYLISSDDNFAKNPDYYWIKAEKLLKENKNA
jgi:hypothetical protein